MSEKLSSLVPELKVSHAEFSAALETVRYGREDGILPASELLVVLEAATPGVINSLTSVLAKPLAITEDLQVATFGRRKAQADLALRAYSSRRYGYRDEDNVGWYSIAYGDVIKGVELVEFLDPEQDDEVRDKIIDLFLGHTLSHKNMFELPRFVQGLALGLESFRQDRAKAKKGKFAYSRVPSLWEQLKGGVEQELGTNPVDSLKNAHRSNAELSVLVSVPDALPPLMDSAIETADVERIGICWAAISKLTRLSDQYNVEQLIEYYRPTVAAMLEDALMKRVGLMQHPACPAWIFEVCANEALRKSELSVLTEQGRPAVEDRRLINYYLGLAMQTILKSKEPIMPGNPEFGMSVAAMVYTKDIQTDCAYDVTTANIASLKSVKSKRKGGAQLRLPRVAAEIYDSLERGEMG